MMKEAIARENDDLVSEHEDYVVQITSDNPDVKQDIYRFKDAIGIYPVVAVTVKMLVTGIDIADCRLIVLAKRVSSNSELFQMIARGSRINPDSDKYFFTVLDFYNSLDQKRFDGSSINLGEVTTRTVSIKEKDNLEEAEKLQKISGAPLLSVESRLHSDHWSKEDYLGYEIYAQAIEYIIKDKESKPPLTIGVIAPWGQGKTTLMRYVWRRFESNPGDQLKPQPWKIVAQPQEILKWTKDSLGAWGKPLEKNPTVWFNPWKYQSSEQIWAGMADAIINQLVAKLPMTRQEEFWLKLQWKRIDKNAIRSDVHKAIFTRLFPNLIITLIAVGAAVIAFNIHGIETGWKFAGIGSVITATLAAFHGVWAWWKEKGEGVAKQLEPYLQSPNYSSSLGAFHHVNEDLERVFALLVSDDSPAIIFIDDLDRCTPNKVVEVMEAINLMMNGKFRHKCYFIMGMDAEMVAASIDVAYEKMRGKIPGKEQAFGSVGWYFLDKFIQLPFLVPTLRREQKAELIQSLFPDTDDGEEKYEVHVNTKQPEESEKKAEQAINEGIKKEIKQLSPIQKKEFEKAFLEKKFEENRDSSDIREKVILYEKFLDPSPRSIKRFANLLRFHSSYQELRQAKNLNYANSDTLAFWLILSLRWPQVVRWLQWYDEREFFQISNFAQDHDSDQDTGNYFVSKSPLEKAQMLDLHIQEIQKLLDFDKAFTNWRKLGAKNNHLAWFNDKELLKLLYEKHNRNSSFEKAFKYRVW